MKAALWRRSLQGGRVLRHGCRTFPRVHPVLPIVIHLFWHSQSVCPDSGYRIKDHVRNKLSILVFKCAVDLVAIEWNRRRSYSTVRIPQLRNSQRHGAIGQSKREVISCMILTTYCILATSTRRSRLSHRVVFGIHCDFILRIFGSYSEQGENNTADSRPKKMSIWQSIRLK